jgi:hypothetical protein
VVAQLSAHRELVKPLVGERPAVVYRMCPFCGAPCRGSACRSHTDLVAIERDLENGLYPKSNEAVAPLEPGSATASPTKGV